MTELDDLERYFITQFEQLDHVCKSASPWIFVCLASFVDFLSQLDDPFEPRGSLRIPNFITKWYPAKYRNFVYRSGDKDLPIQMYVILRSGLVHSFSLTPDRNRKTPGPGRQRSVRLFHRKDTSLKNAARYPDKSHKIDAAVLVAEDFLGDTRSVALKIIRRARRNSMLKTQIINFLRINPPIAGADQGYFWLK